MSILIISCSSDDESEKYDFHGIKVIAHRGYWTPPGSAQNSLTSARMAWENGMHGMGTDVRMSSDSVLYLNHDKDFDGYVIRNTPSNVLDKVLLSNGEPLPRFDDFIELVKDYDGFKLFVEIKSEGNNTYKKYVAEKVTQKLIDYDLLDRTTISSFNLNILQYAKNYEPQVRTRYIVQQNNLDIVQLKNAGVNGISLRYKLALQDPSLVYYLDSEGFEVGLWTINDVKTVLSIIDLPLHTFSTDIPDRVMKIYK